MQTRIRKLAIAVAFAVPLAAAAPGALAQNVKLAYIEVLSGPLGSVGELGRKNLEFAVDEINAKGGVLGRKLEVVPFDSKGSPQEALVQLKSAIDQGINFVTQGNSSAVAGALMDAVAKHNERNPDKRALYLNFAAIDPTLTNEKCNFWHFRFDSHSYMKMAGLTEAIKANPKIKKVYLINQDYAHGHQVAAGAKEMLAKKRPDIQIVGEDLHPIGKVKDFAPYAAKIRAAGADAVITGNWGVDLTLLVRAAKDSGLDIDWYTYYAGAYGSAAAIGEGGIGQVRNIVEWNANFDNPTMDAFYKAYKAKYPKPEDEFYYYRLKVMANMLVKAIEQGKSTDAFKVASALEGMVYKGDLGEVTMRKEDHQSLQNLYVATFDKVGASGVKYSLEGSGFGFGRIQTIPAKDTALPTTCNMQRPAQ